MNKTQPDILCLVLKEREIYEEKSYMAAYADPSDDSFAVGGGICDR